MRLAALLALALAACEGSERLSSEAPSPLARVSTANPYAGDRQALADGRRLYNWMNCSGCHFQGGGGIGPPLMDEKWIYGSQPRDIYESIAQGRPNGMPRYGGMIPEDEIWKIVAYVRALAELDPGLPEGARSTALQEKATGNQ